MNSLLGLNYKGDICLLIHLVRNAIDETVHHLHVL